jgi:methoxymalonate biosynthesis acyl carrier protein
MRDDELALIRGLIAGHMDGVEPADDEDIFASGYVSSLFAVQLVMWVERTFELPLQAKDLDIRNFQTISAIEAFVDRKRGEARSAATASEDAGDWTSA